MNTASANPSTTHIPEDTRCKYPSKRCDNARVIKRDGEHHRFCEFHRLKANLNQQRLEQRRRMIHTSQRGGASPTRAKRSKSLHCELDRMHQPSEFVSLPTLNVEDLDLETLGELLDLPTTEVLGVDDTQAALSLLDGHAASLDMLRQPVHFGDQLSVVTI